MSKRKRLLLIVSITCVAAFIMGRRVDAQTLGAYVLFELGKSSSDQPFEDLRGTSLMNCKQGPMGRNKWGSNSEDAMFLIDCDDAGGEPATKSLSEAVMKLMSVNGVKRV